MDDIEIDGLITCVQSRSDYCEKTDEENVAEFSENDGSASIDKSNLKKCKERIHPEDYDELDSSPLVSEIFVKHPDEESERGDPLGGFLCTALRSDATYIHAFCILKPDGILAKDLLVEERDILVTLNGRMTLGSFGYDHEGVLELFRTLPMLKTISMDKYSRTSEMFTVVEFLLEGTTEVMVKENSVKLMTQPPSVEALIYQRGNTSLAYKNEQLTLCKSPNVFTDCEHHFVVRRSLDEGFYNVYSFQVQKNESKFLGLNGRKLDVIDGKDETCVKRFRKEIVNHDVFLKPCGENNMLVFYNKSKGIYELVSRADALRDEGFGMMILPTPCQP